MTESIEQRLQRLEDTLEIHQLFVDYGRHLDVGDLDAYASCFTEDGELMLGPMGRAKGRDEIRSMMGRTLGGASGSSLHLITSPAVSLDGDSATSVVMWTVVNRGQDEKPQLGMIGRHEDVLVRDTDGRWRIRQRKGFVDIPSVMTR